MSTAHVVKWRTHLWIKYAAFDSHSCVRSFKCSAAYLRVWGQCFGSCSHFSARWNPELLISYLIHQNGPALAGHHLSEMCLQKHVFINHFPFSGRYTVESGLKLCSWELGVAVLNWWGGFGGGGGGGGDDIHLCHWKQPAPIHQSITPQSCPLLLLSSPRLAPSSH